MQSAASTMRNCFPAYRGGAYSRAGTQFVGFSKQTGRAFPPRLIPFQFSINQGLALEFGNLYMRVISEGAFVTETPVNITGVTRANPAVVSAVNTFVNGDWVFIKSVAGMTQVNLQTYVVAGATGASFALNDIYGAPVDSSAFSAYASGGTVARIFTLATIYSEVDLVYLKFTQSADVMSLCCVNQITGTEYAPQDLSRLSDTNWTFTPVVAAPSILPPAGSPTAVASAAGSVNYEYVITSVSPTDGSESVASGLAAVGSAVNIAATAGAITVSWAAVQGVNEYNVYKAPPGYGVAIPTGVLFGFAGSAYGNQFIDGNIVADFTQTPPRHQNPFARGQVLGATITAGGSGYTTSTTATITSATGSGAVLQVVEVGGIVTAILVIDAGSGYLPTDTIAIAGAGTLATATILTGAQTGTYPSVPAYFQERRGYANTLNNPDTYFFSQPGAFTNFDTRIPAIPSDAVIGSPWSVQVDGIQWMVSTAGGLLIMTGQSAWLLVGAGSFATNVQPLGPASQAVTPQAFSGCSATLPPIKINYDILFVESKGSLYYDLPYQLYALSEPLDTTENSSHLFNGFTIIEHAWCEQPNKLLWSVRSDGAMLSFTFLKAQQVAGWARHDTNGLFKSVCSIVEPPVDALYAAVQRFPGTHTAYMIERMDNRIWGNVETCWCVDAALTLSQPTPAATLTASSATGLGAITGVTGLIGGSGYSAATTAAVIDNAVDGSDNPIGSGAVPTLTIVGGVITAIVFSGGNQGSGYVSPQLTITDPAGSAGGSGASVTLILDNSTTFTASAAVFNVGSPGSVIRMGGGIAVITQFNSTTQVVGNMLTPITQTLTDMSGVAVPLPATSGNWTLTAPVSTISGLGHLIGATVTGLADGNVIPPTTVDASGSIVLARAASAVTVGLGFQAQLQSAYLEAGQPSAQGQRKKIAAVTARIEASLGIKVGSNQIDGSTQSPPTLAPVWRNLTAVPDIGPNFSPDPYNSIATPLNTGDIRVPIGGGWATPGQVAFQQDNPLPMQILSIASDLLPGDTPQNQVQPQQRGARGG